MENLNQIGQVRTTVVFDADILELLDKLMKIKGHNSRNTFLNQLLLREAVNSKLVSTDYHLTRYGLTPTT